MSEAKAVSEVRSNRWSSETNASTPSAPQAASQRIGSEPAAAPAPGQGRDQVSVGATSQTGNVNGASPVQFNWANRSAPLVPGGMGAPGTPPAYFAFSSDHPISPRAIQSMAGKYGGKNVMIGVDANSDYGATLKAAREAGTRLHVYVEGPGGPTGKKWTADELGRIENAARKQGIDTRDPKWMDKWNKTGWKAHTFEELGKFKKQGFESAEIDNLYRGLGDSPQKLVDFYREYAGKFQKGELPRALLKNIDGPQMQALGAAIRSGQLPREMFSDFHIFESSAGNPSTPSRLAAELGIRTLVSRDTEQYAASGAYR